MSNTDNIYNILNNFNKIAKDAPAPVAATPKAKTKLQESMEQVVNEKYMGFKKTVAAIKKGGSAEDPEAVAAAIGRKKHGKEKFQKAAAAGKKLGEGQDATTYTVAYKDPKKPGKSRSTQVKATSAAEAKAAFQKWDTTNRFTYLGSRPDVDKVYEELDPEHVEYLKRQADISRSTGLAVGDRVTLKDRPGFEGEIVHDWGGGDFTISGSGGGMSQSKNHRANARIIQKMQDVAEGMPTSSLTSRYMDDPNHPSYKSATSPKKEKTLQDILKDNDFAALQIWAHNNSNNPLVKGASAAGDAAANNIKQQLGLAGKMSYEIPAGVMMDKIHPVTTKAMFDYLRTHAQQGVAEGSGDPQIPIGMETQYGTVVSVNVKKNTVTVKASNGELTTVNIQDIDQGVAEGSSENKYSNLSNRGVNRGINRAGDDFNRMMDLDQVESPHYKTQHQQNTKQRLKTKPMVGPKGVLPEQGVAEGMVKGEYGRVLDALQLYYPRLSMEELNVPGYHKVVADKANVSVKYAARVINDFTRDNDPNEFDDFDDDEQGVTEARFPTVADARKRAEQEKGTGKFTSKKNPDHPSGTIYTRKYNPKSGETDDTENVSAEKRRRGAPKKSAFEDMSTIDKMIAESFGELFEGTSRPVGDPVSKAAPTAPGVGSGIRVTPMPALATTPKPAIGMGTIKGGVFTATPPKPGEQGVAVPQGLDEVDAEMEGMRKLAGLKGDQPKLDRNQDGELTRKDFEMLRKGLEEGGRDDYDEIRDKIQWLQGAPNYLSRDEAKETAYYTKDTDPVWDGYYDDADEVGENLEVRANPAGASSAEQAKKIGAQFPQQNGKEPNLAYKIGEDEVEENLIVVPNLSGAGSVAAAKKLGAMMPAKPGEKDPISTNEDDMEVDEQLNPALSTPTIDKIVANKAAAVKRGDASAKDDYDKSFVGAYSQDEQGQKKYSARTTPGVINKIKDTFGLDKPDSAYGPKAAEPTQSTNEGDMEEGNVITKAMADKNIPVGAPIPGTNLKKTKHLDTMAEDDAALNQMRRIAGLKECGMSPISGMASDMEKQQGNMNISTSQNSDGTKSVTISADGDAASDLMQMLKLAGMGGGAASSPAAAAEPEIVVVAQDGEETMEEEKDPRYQASTTPDEQVAPVQALTKGGNGDVAGQEKEMKPGGYQFGDNNLAMQESLSAQLMKEYNSIKVKK